MSLTTEPLPYLQRLQQQRQPTGKKPILKHRSISDLLTSALPSSRSHVDDTVSDETEPQTPGDDFEYDEDDDLARPMLLHTKSDTNLTSWARRRPCRKDSPPRIIAPVLQTTAPFPNVIRATDLAERSGSSDSARETTGSSQDLSGPAQCKKKHISFNTFVEQCIAIEQPQKRGSSDGRRSMVRVTSLVSNEFYDDGSVHCPLLSIL